MKKLLFLILSILTITGCINQNTNGSRKLMKTIVINHALTDSVYRYYGYYKEVFMIYNYQYNDSSLHSIQLDSNSWIDYYINEYKDTISKIYVDATNYPRREE